MTPEQISTLKTIRLLVAEAIMESIDCSLKDIQDLLEQADSALASLLPVRKAPTDQHGPISFEMEGKP